jgi:ankyrin repeat protein
MNLFFSLPRDLQGVISSYLSVKQCCKLSIDDDFFWQEKAKSMTTAKPNYKLFCMVMEKAKKHKHDRMLLDLKFYKEYISSKKWEEMEHLVEDDVFLKEYINCFDINGNTILMHYCSRSELFQREYYIKFLIDRGADVNIKSLRYGYTALMFAHYNRKSLNVVKLLLEAGSDVLSTNYNGDNVLTLANIFDIPTLKLLLEHGLNINHQGRHRKTILHKQIFCSDSSDRIRFLLNSGIDVSIKDDYDKRAIDYARESIHYKTALDILEAHS